MICWYIFFTSNIKDIIENLDENFLNKQEIHKNEAIRK